MEKTITRGEIVYTVIPNGGWQGARVLVHLHEERIATVTNRMGQPGAYCMVADIRALLNMAELEGMVWVARDRELTNIFGVKA